MIYVWHGELYLEQHRGSFTSQGFIKRANRKNEILLKNVELMATIAFLHNYPYPSTELDHMWKLLLLNQFHDVLPGTSIASVYDDSRRHYDIIERAGTKLLDQNAKIILIPDISCTTVFNSLSWTRREVIDIYNQSNKETVLIEAQPMGFTHVVPLTDFAPITVDTTDTTIVVTSSKLCIEISRHNGTLLNVTDRVEQRPILSGPGNVFVMYDDVPLFWDAWDVEFYHFDKPALDLLENELSNTNVQLLESGPLRAVISVKRSLTKTSSLVQNIVITADSNRIDFRTEVDWHEAHKFLKVQFPTTIDDPNRNATYEIQYGHIQRPTHNNTSWDWARFEVHAQNWFDLSEYGYGVAVLNDCKHGCSVRGNVLSLSLLRAPKAPDENCDMGLHSFTYSLYPHRGSLQQGGVIHAAHELNCPLIVHNAMKSSYSIISEPNKKNVIIQFAKKAHESDNIVLRLYECFGGLAQNVEFVVSISATNVHVSNILEESIPNSTAVEWSIESDNKTRVRLAQVKLFQIITIILQQ